MKKLFALLPLLLLPALAGCNGGSSSTQVKLDFGTKIGLDADLSPRSHLKFVKRSKVNQLVSDKGNFILLVHGSSDTCTCYTEFHEKVLVPYVKYHKALIYAIDLEEFESDSNYLGITRIVGVDTLAIFEGGILRYQHTTEDLTDKWVSQYATFNDWMRERAVDARIFYVDESILDSYYQADAYFTVYFTLEGCPDCRYLDRTALRSYLGSHEVTEQNFFYFDMSPYWADAELKAEKMAKYGLSVSGDPVRGLDRGYVPTIFYVQPDRIHYNGDVVEAAGVFYNETSLASTNGIIEHTYFTAERLEEGKDTFMSYLANSNVETKVLAGINAGIPAEGEDRHDPLAKYETPIFNALLDYAIGAK